MAHFGHLKCCTIDHNVQTYRNTNVQWSLKLIEVLESQDILRGTGGNLSAFPARMKEVTQKKPDRSLKWICRWSRVTMEWRSQARLGGLGLQPGHWTQAAYEENARMACFACCAQYWGGREIVIWFAFHRRNSHCPVFLESNYCVKRVWQKIFTRFACVDVHCTLLVDHLSMVRI